MTDIIALLKAEQKRAVEHLSKYEPCSEEYARCLSAAREMDCWLEQLESASADDSKPVPITGFRPTVVETPSAPTVAATETEPAPVVNFDTEAYKAALRERMADARLKGADTKAWLSEVGAAKFSAITDPCKLMKLNELVTEFEKEHP